MIRIILFAGISLQAMAAQLPGWHGLWTRDRDGGRAIMDGSAIRIEHEGRQDWALTRRERMTVAAGDLFEMSASVKVAGTGYCNIGVVTRTKAGKVIEWMYGADTSKKADGWQRLHARFLITEDIHSIEPRLTGAGQATVWLKDFSCRKTGNLDAIRNRDFPQTCRLSNQDLALTYHPANGLINVIHKPTGIHYKQFDAGTVVGLRCTQENNRIQATLMHVATGLTFDMMVELEKDRPEYRVMLEGKGPLKRALAFPHPYVQAKDTSLVIPMNEGISYPVTDPAIPGMRLIAYGGHGICMAFWGATNGAAGHMAIIETPDDAAIRIHRVKEHLAVSPEWDPRKGRFGYGRKLRYAFFKKGAHVAICKRYRKAMKARGNLVTLADKRRANPHVDRLIGAVNVWCWDRDALAIVKDLQAAGIERILWSHRSAPTTIKAMNALPGVLTSRYDIYQDVMDPANFKHLRGVHPDWTTEAWPAELMRDARGDWRRGWRVKGKDGVMRPCGVLCDACAPAHAEKRIGLELATHPYRCRFIDTTTASSWRECHDPAHPMTRTDSRIAKMKLLETVSRRFNLVTGSETGHDAAVPHVHYFEGMLSLGPYRVPDAGRNMGQILKEVPERVAKFQVGHAYRLPLWELVYHDCVVAQWYWGDYNNKLPAIWDKRNLFNALYGTPPMFMFNRRFWHENKDRFVQSYRLIAPVARAAGYSEMVDHRFLTPDRAVQQTRFANGVTVTVNFGDKAAKLPDGREIKPMAAQVQGIKNRSSQP